jgi:cytochrome c-type biogenesis protein CcmF
MISLIGNLCLCAGMISVTLCTLCVLLPRSTKAITFAAIKCCFIAQSALTALSFSALVYGFYISDFSIQNVFLNSSSIVPTLFKVSGAWASHEGSILLWYAMLSIVASLCVYHSDQLLLKTSILILTPILLGFGAFIYFVSNPFIKMQINMPHQGMGLNPLLQDIGLSLHPPMLYIGYVTYLAPFLYSCLSLLHPERSSECIKNSVTFSKFGWLTLTIGVSLGSWWAYRELGWGGFWFFDPVENISLLPLISAIAFHHSLIFASRNSALVKWAILLGITTFLLTLLGTFLVRSGMLTSVHSFADNSGKAKVLLWIASSLAVFSYSLYITRFNLISSDKPLIPSLKARGIFSANIIWVLSIITLLFAIVYPIILGLTGKNVVVSIEYYTNTFIPLTIPTLLLAGSFAYFKAKNTTYIDYYVSLLIAGLIGALAHFKIQSHSPMIIIAIFSSVFLMVSTVLKTLEKSNYLKQVLSPKMTAMLLSHFGYGLMALSITLNSSMQNEFDFIGKQGDVRQYNGYKITLQNIAYSKHANYYRQIAEFWIESPESEVTILKPENRFYEIEQAITAESDIYSYLTHDLYAVLSKIDDDIIHAKIYYRPCIGLLWVSAMIIIGGLLISLLSSHQRVPKFT